MGILDIVILVCLLIAFISGIRRGLISQLVAIAALILSVWCSMKFSMAIFGWLSDMVSDAPPAVVKTLSFIVIFIAVAIVMGILGRLLEKCIRLVMLGWLNRLLGAILAVSLCVFVLGLTAILFDTLYSQWALSHEVTGLPEFISKSIFYEPIHRSGSWIFPYLSKLSV